MSNYPPTPSFGGPFNYNSHFSQPLSGPHNVLPQSGYAQARDPIYPPQHSQYYPTQYGNAYAFSTNAQKSTTLMSGTGMPPPPPLLNYGGYMNGSVPPPPFPSIPIPGYRALVQQETITENQSQTQSTLQPHTSLPPKPITHFAGVVEAENEELPASNAADREDGELSDSERSKEANKVASQMWLPPKNAGFAGVMTTSDNLDQSNTTDQHVALNVGFKAAIPPKFLVEPQQDSYSGNTNHETTSELIRNMSSESKTTRLNLVQTDKMNGTTPRSTKSPLQGRGNISKLPWASQQLKDASKRELAKHNLLEIHSCGFGYESLVSEGIAVSTLKDLYPEIGLEVPRSSSPQSRPSPTPREETQGTSTQTISNEPARRPVTITENNTDVNHLRSPTLSTVIENNGINQLAKATSEQDDSTIAATVKLNMHVSPKDPRNSRGPEVRAVAPIIEQPQASGIIKKATNLIVSDKNLERKDYIARMLAAKTGKTIVANKIAQPSSTLNTLAQKEALCPPDSNNHPVELVHDMNPKILLPNEKAALDAKRKAQTELARQKIEALKLRGRTNSTQAIKETEVYEPVDTDPPDLLPSPELPILTQPEILVNQTSKVTTVTIRDPEHSTAASLPAVLYTPPSSLFSSLGRKPSSGIPGLFMSQSFIPQAVPVRQTTPPPRLPSPVAVVPTLPEPSNQVNVDIRGTSTTSDVAEPVELPSMAANRLSNRPMTKAEVSSGPRKRAKASDFIDSPSYRVKRRLGSSKEPQVVIEVSDDEAEFVDTSEVDVGGNNRMPEVHMNGPIGDLGNPIPTRDLPASNEGFPKPSMAFLIDTPPAIQTPGKGKEQEYLKHKEKEIVSLQKRIAEMEQKLRAKQSTSRAQTPGTPRHPGVTSNIDTTPEQTKQRFQDISNINNSSEAASEQPEAQTRERGMLEAKLQNKVEVADQVGAAELLEVDDAQSEAVRTARSTEIQQRQTRRAELEAGLPQLDAAVDKTKFELESVKQRIGTLEAEIQAGIQGRQAIVNELEALALLELEKPSPLAAESSDHESSQKIAETNESGTEHPETIDTTDVEQDDAVNAATSTSTDLPAGPLVATPDLPPSLNEQIEVYESAEDNMEISVDTADEGEITDDSNLMTDKAVTAAPSIHSTQGYELSIPDILPVQGAMEISGSEHSEDMQMVDRVTPDPAQLALVTVPNRGDTPNELQNLQRTSGYSDLQKPPTASRSLSIASDSDYEPPEPETAVDNRAGSTESAPFSPKSPNPLLVETEAAHVSSSAVLSNTTNVVVTATASARAQYEDQLAPTTLRLPLKYHSVPYESPLKQFKSYRYHPNYLSDVPGGFRSLTFSHNIDAHKPICRWELAGGTCNDDSCDSQHFRSMGLSDDMVLVQMGSVHEGATPAEKDAYVAGLKRIIQDMRGRKVKDFNVVASEITAYRRRFLGDASRVLTL